MVIIRLETCYQSKTCFILTETILLYDLTIDEKKCPKGFSPSRLMVAFDLIVFLIFQMLYTINFHVGL